MSDEIPDLSDEADQALSTAAGGSDGNDLVSGRRDSTDAIVSIGPDVLWTPRGGGMVPVAYSVIAFADTAVRTSMSVRNNGYYDFQLNSRTTKIQGHEPGTGRGVVVSGYMKYSHVEVAADYVYSEGFATVSHGDDAWMNHPDVGPTEAQRGMSEREV